MRATHCLAKIASAGVLALCSVPAYAQSTVTDTFRVTITIQGTCLVISASDIDFGTQLSGPGTYTQNGLIQVQCTKDLPFLLGLDGGTTTGDVSARAMTNGAGVEIPYSLHQTSPTGPNWGNDPATGYSGTGLGVGPAYNIDLTVYAEAVVAGSEPVGTYSDTVTATVTY